MCQAGPAIKEIAKNPPAQDPKVTSAKGKAKGGKEKDAAPVKEKPKRKGPLDVLPNTVEEWSVYDTPDEVRTIKLYIITRTITLLKVIYCGSIFCTFLQGIINLNFVMSHNNKLNCQAKLDLKF